MVVGLIIDFGDQIEVVPASSQQRGEDFLVAGRHVATSEIVVNGNVERSDLFSEVEYVHIQLLFLFFAGLALPLDIVQLLRALLLTVGFLSLELLYQSQVLVVHQLQVPQL